MLQNQKSEATRASIGSSVKLYVSTINDDQIKVTSDGLKIGASNSD